MHRKQLSFFLIGLTLFWNCKEQKSANPPQEQVSVKSAYASNFHIGAALNKNQILEKDSLVTQLIAREFSSITAENIMKSMHIHPEKEVYDFKIPDAFVAFGEKYNMHIQGHTLIWHSQLSPFFSEIKDSTGMVEAMTKHIQTIVNRYKGKIDAWDVLNEALNDDGTLRESVFYKVLGEDYIALAFKLSAEADPEAELFYNDYSMTNPEKRAGAIKMIKNLQSQGVKIDGIGMQGHWGLKTPSLAEIEKSITDYAALGLKVDITELDISVIPMPWDFSGADVNVKFESDDPTMNPYPDGLPEVIQKELAQRYQDIFKLFLKHEDKINRVTFWGVNDGDSWKNDWPIKGRTDYPLLFNRKNQPKEAYYRILDLKN